MFANLEQRIDFVYVNLCHLPVPVHRIDRTSVHRVDGTGVQRIKVRICRFKVVGWRLKAGGDQIRLKVECKLQEKIISRKVTS